MAFVDREYLTNQFKAFLAKCNEVFAKKSEIPPTPHIPTKISELENDEGYIKEVAIATLQKAGIVKPDGTTIDIDADGTIKVIGGSGGGGGTGTAYTPKIGTVTVESQGNPPNVSITLDEQALTASYNFVLPKGKDGRSITGIETDDNNNVIVTFSDSTKQKIGQIKFDISADFLTDDGFGNLRYYQSRFQVFNKDYDEWVDATVDPQNPYILQMIPQEMQHIIGIYDIEANHYKLKWTEPKDTVLDGQSAVIVEKVVIVRKKGSAPLSIDDGDTIITVTRSQFGSYSDTFYEDGSFSPHPDDVYYYKAFPVSTTGFVNESSVNEVAIKAKDYVLYGFKIDQNESDPEHMITYLPDCDNANFRSAHMDYNLGVFDYGDWTVDGGAWFMDVKPCLLNQNGTVSKYLDPDDYAKDIGGNDVKAEIENGDDGENVMIEVPKVYWKIVPSDGGNTANIYISNINLKYENGNVTKAQDGNFVCWSHVDEKGEEIPYCYMPAYNGSDKSGVLRSLSGQTPIYSQNAQTETNHAKANNEDGSNIWYTEVYCDRVLINLLLLLIGKSTDTQTVFGQGYHTGGQQTSNPRMTTGTMNSKGLFYGTNSGTWGDGKTNGVKVFGMEHYWGNQWRRIAGWILNNLMQKVKMTYGQGDGSKTDGYNLNGDNYIEIQGSTPSGTSGGYINKCLFTEHGIIPVTANGTNTTHYTDGLWFNIGQNNYAIVGGCSEDSLRVGALFAALNNKASIVYWAFGAALSCKPLAYTFQS